MTGDRALLSNVVEKAGPLVTFGDNSKGLSEGYGCFKMCTSVLMVGESKEEVSAPHGLCTCRSIGLCNLFFTISLQVGMNWCTTQAIVKNMVLGEDTDPKAICQWSVSTSPGLNPLDACADSGSDIDSSDEFNKDGDLRTPIAPPVTSLRMAKVIFLTGIKIDSKINSKFGIHREYIKRCTERTLEKDVQEMISDMALLSQFKEMDGPLVTFGDNNKGFIMGYVKIISGNVVIEYLALVAGLEGYSLKRTAYNVYVLEQKKIMESTYVTFDDDKCPGLECLDENETEVLKFENLNIDCDSEDEAEVNTSSRIDEESTEQVNHENGSSSQSPEFDSTNSGGER
ncbi:hypothetical protein AgCh_039966 [Apium graveolens]